MILTDVETGEAREVLFNPTEVTIEGDPEWTRVKVPAFSYKRLNFDGKANDVVSFKLVIDALADYAQETNHLENMVAFLASLRCPPDDPETIGTAAPHEVLLIWPGWLALVGVLTKCKFKATRFAPPTLNPNPVPTRLECELAIEESRSLPMGAESTRLVGFNRG